MGLRKLTIVYDTKNSRLPADLEDIQALAQSALKYHGFHVLHTDIDWLSLDKDRKIYDELIAKKLARKPVEQQQYGGPMFVDHPIAKDAWDRD